jgi:hypothetical protein
LQIVTPNSIQKKLGDPDKPLLVYYYAQKHDVCFGFHSRNELYRLDDDAMTAKFTKAGAHPAHRAPRAPHPAHLTLCDAQLASSLLPMQKMTKAMRQALAEAKDPSKQPDLYAGAVRSRRVRFCNADRPLPRQDDC